MKSAKIIKSKDDTEIMKIIYGSYCQILREEKILDGLSYDIRLIDRELLKRFMKAWKNDENYTFSNKKNNTMVEGADFRLMRNSLQFKTLFSKLDKMLDEN